MKLEGILHRLIQGSQIKWIITQKEKLLSACVGPCVSCPGIRIIVLSKSLSSTYIVTFLVVVGWLGEIRGKVFRLYTEGIREDSVHYWQLSVLIKLQKNPEM